VLSLPILDVYTYLYSIYIILLHTGIGFLLTTTPQCTSI